MTKRCLACKQERPYEDFCKEKRKLDGRAARCKQCVKEKKHAYRPKPVEGHRTCTFCGESRPLDQFSKVTRTVEKKSRTGLESRCKECYNAHRAAGRIVRLGRKKPSEDLAVHLRKEIGKVMLPRLKSGSRRTLCGARGMSRGGRVVLPPSYPDYIDPTALASTRYYLRSFNLTKGQVERHIERTSKAAGTKTT